MCVLYDILIVGAGPAGAVAAWALARGGAKVILVDRATFPRDKVCGDGLTPRGVAIAREMGVNLAVQGAQPFHGCRVYTPYGRAVDIPLAKSRVIKGGLAGTGFLPALPMPLATSRASDPIAGQGFVVPRLLLDNLLLQAAASAGAEVMTGVHITTPVVEDGLVVGARGQCVATGQEIALRARLTIVADGSAGGFSARLGLRDVVPTEAVAIRAYYSGVSGLGNWLEVHFLRRFLPYYGWIFPLAGGGANVGVFLERQTLSRLPLQTAFRHFVETTPRLQEALAEATVETPLRAFPLRMGFAARRVAINGALAVGDAAGLIHPLTGEGMANAMESGLVAARYALRALAMGDTSAQALSGYGRELERIFGRAHRLAHLARIAFHSPLLTHLFFTIVGSRMEWS